MLTDSRPTTTQLVPRSPAGVGNRRGLVWAESVGLILLVLGIGWASWATRPVPAAPSVPATRPLSSTPGGGAAADPCIVPQAALGPSGDRVCLTVE